MSERRSLRSKGTCQPIKNIFKSQHYKQLIPSSIYNRIVNIPTITCDRIKDLKIQFNSDHGQNLRMMRKVVAEYGEVKESSQMNYMEQQDSGKQKRKNSEVELHNFGQEILNMNFMNDLIHIQVNYDKQISLFHQVTLNNTEVDRIMQSVLFIVRQSIIKDYHYYIIKNLSISDIRYHMIENNVVYLKKCLDSNYNFFTDPKSPYQLLSKQLTNIFLEENGLTMKPKILSKQFQLKKSTTNICTYFFPNNSFYYNCKQCCIQRPGVTMCYCEGCWDEDMHAGHQFRKVAASRGAYCDCGRQCRIKPQATCKKHRQIQKQIKVDISDNQREDFISYFSPLIHCYLYLRINQQSSQQADIHLETLITKKLEQLVESSIHYIRLASIMFSQKIQIQQKNRTMLEWIIIYNKNSWQQTLFAMIGDNEFKIQLIKTISKISKQGIKPLNLRLIFSELYESDYPIYKLAKQGIFLTDKTQKYLEIALRSCEGQQLLVQFLQSHKKQDKLFQFIIGFFKQKQLKAITQMKIVVQYVVTELLDNFQAIYNKNIDQTKLLQIVLIFLYSFADFDLHNISQKLQQKLTVSQKQGLLLLLTYFVEHLTNYLIKSTQQTQFYILIAFQIIKQNQDRAKLIKLLWQNFTKTQKPYEQSIGFVIQKIYNLTAIITQSQGYLSTLNSKAVQTNTQSIQQLEHQMKSFLYEHSLITKTQLLAKRLLGNFNFKNAGKILKQLCVYNQVKDSFIYVSDKKFPNYIERLKLRKKNLNWDANFDFKNMFCNKFRISDTFQTECPSFISQVLQLLYGQDGFYENFSLKFWQTSKKVIEQNQRIEQWKKQQIGLYFLYTMIYSNVLSHHKNKNIAREIQQIKGDQNKLAILKIFCENQQNLIEALQIQYKKQVQEESNSAMCMNEAQEIDKDKQKSPQSTQKIEKSPKNAQKNSRFINKLNKLKQKYQNSHQKHLQCLKQQSPIKNETNSQNQQHFCIVCRQGNLKNDKLMFIAQLDKKISISNIFYPQQTKTQVLISSCFHCIHSACLANINKSNFQFNCPLCQKTSNILMPIDIEDRKSCKRSQNMINAMEVVKNKNLDFDSLANFLFQHLIGNYGLNSLVCSSYYEENKKNMRKIDNIILNMLTKMFANFSQAQKQDFSKQLKQLQFNIVTCQKKNLRLIQKLFTHLIYKKIKNEQNIQNQYKQLRQLKSKVIQSQFQIILQNAEQIMGNKLNIQWQQQNNGKECQKKQFIQAKLLNPPKNSTDLKNFCNQWCQNCSKGTNKKLCGFICLLCHKYYCHQCFSVGNNSHMITRHQNNFGIIYFAVSNNTIVVKQAQSKIDGSHAIYFDAFMTTLEDAKKYKSQEVYQLNQAKIQKIYKSFLLRR